MREILDEQSRLALMHYRMERACETMEEASILAEHAHYNAAVNRLYYACFYAAQALLLKHRFAATTHSGVKSMLGLHFVSKGIIPIEHGKTFNTLFEKRHSSDYEAFAYCDEALLSDLKAACRSVSRQDKGTFVDRIGVARLCQNERHSLFPYLYIFANLCH